MRLPAASPIELASTQATPRADIEKAARELETQFAQMLIKSMRSASPDGGLGGDTRYRDMYDQQLARELDKGRGLGLAPMIMRQLERSTGNATEASTGALPLRGTGAARAFMAYLHLAARLSDASRVRLKVHPDNASALALYRSMGYRFSDQLEPDGQMLGILELLPGRRTSTP